MEAPNSQKVSWSGISPSSRLPYADYVNVAALARLFSSTATSYKYLFMLASLNILEDTRFERLHMTFDEILREMLAVAWFPHTYARLSFGVSDTVSRTLDAIEHMIATQDTAGIMTRETIRHRLEQAVIPPNSLMNMVPYRILTPFFAAKDMQCPDWQRNARIAQLSHDRFETTRPLYMVDRERREIVMHPSWMLYLYENQSMVRAFVSWEWLQYMQRRNPSALNLAVRLFPPAHREPLTAQTKFWKEVMASERLCCIYSGQEIGADRFSLDHFLPWSFVGHDQLWNLIPVSSSINSSKSNKLPSLRTYFDTFAELQFRSLSIVRGRMGARQWSKTIEPYLADLRLTPDEVLRREPFSRGLRAVVEPLYALASAQGFTPGWEYQKESTWH